MSNNKLINLFYVCLALLMFSCMNEQSSLNTLDEFAGISGGKFNVCTGNFSVSGTNITAGSFDKVVKETLRAVPTNFQKIFFQAGGKIVVSSSQASSYCSKVINDSSVVRDIYGGSKSGVLTCWRHIKGKPVIFLEEDEAKIRHSLLRVFSYFFMQAIVPAAKKNSSLSSSADDFMAQLNRLSESFLSDLKKINSGRASRLSSEFSRDLLNQYVLAESFDSYYCNSSTKASMRSNFSSTYDTFVKYFLYSK